MKDLRIQCPLPMLLTDNNPAEQLIRAARISHRSKHIAIHYHFVRDHYEKGDYTVAHVTSADNLADICTKALARPILHHLSVRLGLLDGKMDN
jgi:hypothetical protein